MPNGGDTSERLPVFVVTDHPVASRWLLSLFSDPYFRVTLATSFNEAKRLLLEHKPELIVAAVQLGEFNGLGLVLRAQVHNPNVRAVVLSRVADRVLQADAESIGATFVTLPIEHRELRAAIIRTLFRQEQIGAPSPIRAPYERRRGQASPPAADAQLTVAAAERQRREALFPIPPPAMIHLNGPRFDS
jgi:DNA-binding response OmpR family regulator